MGEMSSIWDDTENTAGSETWQLTASLPILQVLFQIGFNLLSEDCACCSFIN